MKTNKDHLVIQGVQGRVHHPTLRGNGYRVGFDGVARILPAVGGITYNYFVGDSCMNIVGDHVEPGVSSKNADALEDGAYNTFACVGNVAKVVSGDAKGSLGFVSGKHGGIDHVIIAFDAATLDKMLVDDKILVYGCGQGLQLNDYQDVMCMNLDPNLLDKLNIKEDSGKLVIDVTHIIGGELMGSGLGSASLFQGDFDIMTQDKKANELYHLESLRFGDLVMIENCYCGNGAIYKKGATSIGIIVHSDSFTAGHGPGVTILFTCANDTLIGNINKDANIANYLEFKK